MRLKPIRHGAAMSLRSLWKEGTLDRRLATDDRAGFHEAKYVRPEDASGTDLIACARCGGERRSLVLAEGRTLESCPGRGLADRTPA